MFDPFSTWEFASCTPLAWNPKLNWAIFVGTYASENYLIEL